MKRALLLSRVYPLLESGPVVPLTTARKRRPNIMTLSWYTMMELEPPLVGCVVSDRNFTFATLKATKACVINIPTVELAKKVVGCGNVSERAVDKFALIGSRRPLHRASRPRSSPSATPIASAGRSTRAWRIRRPARGGSSRRRQRIGNPTVSHVADNYYRRPNVSWTRARKGYSGLTGGGARAARW
jgi:Flavin reductase like domain